MKNGGYLALGYQKSNPQKQFQPEFTSIAELFFRYNIYQNACATVNAHNALYELGQTTFTLGLNKYSTLTDKEKKARNGLKVPKKYTGINFDRNWCMCQ
jgi:hypothetical protein